MRNFPNPSIHISKDLTLSRAGPDTLHHGYNLGRLSSTKFFDTLLKLSKSDQDSSTLFWAPGTPGVREGLNSCRIENLELELS